MDPFEGDSLERQARHELDIPCRRIGVHYACYGPCTGHVHRRSWRSELGRIKQVEHLPPQLQGYPFAEPEVLKNREVDIVKRWPDQTSPAGIPKLVS